MAQKLGKLSMLSGVLLWDKILSQVFPAVLWFLFQFPSQTLITTSARNTEKQYCKLQLFSYNFRSKGTWVQIIDFVTLHGYLLTYRYARKGTEGVNPKKVIFTYQGCFALQDMYNCRQQQEKSIFQQKIVETPLKIKKQNISQWRHTLEATL